MNNLAKLLVTASLSIGIPIATLLQNYMDFLWPYLGWIAIGVYLFLQFFLPVLVPLGQWLKGIMEWISSSFESSPTPEATLIYILLTVIIIVFAIIINMVKPKPSFVEEFEAKYDHPPEITG